MLPLLRALLRASRRRQARSSVLLAIVLLAGLPTPVAAHSADNTPASNYVTRVLRISDQISGATVVQAPFRFEAIEAGSRVALEWRSGRDLLVRDYDGHPYLLVTGQGVYENRQSNATYLNRDRNGTTDSPENLNPAGPPVWARVGDGSVARWHDHRAHHMGGIDPPAVQREPKRTQEVGRNTIVIEVLRSTTGRNGPGTIVLQTARSYAVDVQVMWEPTASPVRWFALAAVVAAAIAVIALAGSRSLSGRTTALRVMVPAMFVLIVVDAVHLIGISFGVDGGGGPGRLFSIGFASIAAWLAGTVGAVMIVTKRLDGLYLVTFAAGLVALVGGLSDVKVLGLSSFAFAFPSVVARIAISLTIGLGVGLAVAGVLLSKPIGSTNDGAFSTRGPGLDPADQAGAEHHDDATTMEVLSAKTRPGSCEHIIGDQSPIARPRFNLRSLTRRRIGPLRERSPARAGGWPIPR